MSRSKMRAKLGWSGLVLLVLVLAVLAYQTWQARAVNYLSYTLVNSLQYVTLDEVDEALTPYLSQSFWQVDLNALKQRLESLTWVSQARVKRSWPGYIELELIEHQPVARWGKDALISDQGVVFYPSDMSDFETWVGLDGDVLQASQVLALWREVEIRLQPLGWRVSRLTQQVDGVMRIELAQGTTILLDRPQWTTKLARFVKAYPQISKKLVESAKRFDLRYSNGLAIGRDSTQLN
ncbi:MAG: FtsQ-type POTRA domain-containing protein [Thiomicrospira sp.]